MKRCITLILVLSVFMSGIVLAEVPAITEPTIEPTIDPTVEPTTEPTIEVTIKPTAEPTIKPTTEPTIKPTAEPTIEPTSEPTIEPTIEPTSEPAAEPTSEPTINPTAEPTSEPAINPTAEPTSEPTINPTIEPTPSPTPEPATKPAGGGGGRDKITVYITAEKLTLGQGFIVEPTVTEVRYGTTCAELIDRVVGSGNYMFSGSLESGMYIIALKDKEEETNIPAFIMDKLKTVGKRHDSSMLAEFDYSASSGWLYSVNDKFPGMSASARTLNDNDVVRLQFSLYGIGLDIKDGGLIKTADKSELIRLAAELRDEYGGAVYRNDAYAAAMEALEKADAAQKEVDAAFDQLAAADFSRNAGGYGAYMKPAEKKTEVNTEAVLRNFTDVAPEAPYTPALAQLMSRGIIIGTSQGRFEPDAEFTAGMLAAMLYRESGHTAGGFAWYVEPMAWAVSNGYIRESDSFKAIDGRVMNEILERYLTSRGKTMEYRVSDGAMTRADGVANYVKVIG